MLQDGAVSALEVPPPPALDSGSFKPTAARVHKMAERFKGLATKLDDLSSAPGTFMVKGESEILRVVL